MNRADNEIQHAGVSALVQNREIHQSSEKRSDSISKDLGCGVSV